MRSQKTYRAPKWVFAAIYLPCIAMLAAIVLVSIYRPVPVKELTRDIATVAKVHPFTGALSSICILLWCTSAVTCLFTWVFVRQRRMSTISRFLLSSGLFTSVLLLDDLFLLHGCLAPYYLGLSERATYVIYASVMVIYLVVFRKTILNTDYFLLFSALVFFAISIAADQHLLWRGPWSHLIEDGSEFLGIANWCGYYVLTSFQFLAATSKKDK